MEALRNGDADISFMGGLPFVLAEKEIGAVPLLSEVYRGAPTYTGRVFVRKDSGIETLADLKDRDIAFADPISESGYMFPLAEFEKAGLITGTGCSRGFLWPGLLCRRLPAGDAGHGRRSGRCGGRQPVCRPAAYP